MNPLPIRLVAIAAGLAVLIAILMRRRYQPRAFLPYIGVVVACDVLNSVWPDVFFTRSSWVVQQILFAVTRFALVFELGGIALRGFPGALQRWAVLVAATVTCTAIAAALWTPVPVIGCSVDDNLDCALYEAFYFSTVPRLVTATIWILAWTALFVRGFGLPITTWEKTIMIGLGLYLAVFATSLGFIAQFGWGGKILVTSLRSGAWILLCTTWAVLALRDDQAVEAPAAGVRFTTEGARG